MLPATKTGTGFTYQRRAANAIKSVWLSGIVVSRLHRMTKVTDNNLILLLLLLLLLLF
jgi:hypothetical protein